MYALDIKITKATDSHLGGIMDVWKWFMDYHRTFSPFFARREDGHLNFGKWVRELLSKEDNNLVLVALGGDKVIGYTIAQVKALTPVLKYEKVGFISDMAVMPLYQRRKIGEQLLNKAFAWFDSLGIERVHLRVVDGNQVGNSFWKKHGFREISHTLYLDRKR